MLVHGGSRMYTINLHSAPFIHKREMSMKPVMLILICTFLALPVYAADPHPPVYVILFMHNEDGALGDFNDPRTEISYLSQREELVRFSSMLHDHDVPFCWQSDWVFLKGVLEYDNTQLMDSTTNGKNLLRYMSEDMGITVEAHSHENFGYNYADVAYLIDSLGVTPTPVIGGHIWDPYSSQYANWERFREPLQGSRYTNAWWEANILIGAGTPNHTYDPAPSGIWRPKDKYNFWTDDPDGPVVCVGQYTKDIQGLLTLTGLYETGAVDTSYMLTCSFMTPQKSTSGFTQEYLTETLQPLLDLRDQGKIEMVTFTGAVDIWQNRFGGRGHIYNRPQISVPDSFAVRIPSSSAGRQGLYAVVRPPDSPRYGSAAPVAVHVPGGWDAAGVGGSSFGFTQQGFVEIHFNFPGGGVPGQASGGTYDQRGEACVKAAADIAAFAMGRKADSYGYYLDQMLGAVTPLADNTGLCGWSNGGNITISAAGAWADSLQGLAWIVNWESPVGDGMPTVDAGGHACVNYAYDPSTGVFDWSKLAYSSAIVQEGGMAGGLFFDMNSNGAVDQGWDFVLSPRLYNGKLYYSHQARAAAAARSIFLPQRFATAAACDTFWLWRNGGRWIDAAGAGNENLMFIVEAGDRDHVQGAPDHPHILAQYNGFRQSGIRFARLNPDRAYIEYMAGISMPDAPDNDAFAVFDHISVRQALEPRGQGGVPMKTGGGAAMCEAADRTQYNNTAAQAGAVLTGLPVPVGVQPGSFRLIQNYPNPFNSSTVIGFFLDMPGRAAVTVFNVRGEAVKQWEIADAVAGFHQVVWDGTDRHGIDAGSGIYVYRVSTGGNRSAAGRMVLMR